jgi:hypothetical protein
MSAVPAKDQPETVDKTDVSRVAKMAERRP